jgi:uncharacterized protein
MCYTYLAKACMLLCVALASIGISACSVQKNTVGNKKMSSSKTYALRLLPNMDLKQEIEAFAKKNNIQAGYIITCVGSLKKASLRLANQSSISTWDQKFEIVSLVGTLSAAHGLHLHASISDSTGTTIGGHLVPGNIIYTTAEIVIGEALDLAFIRELDSTTTYKELKIIER